MVNVAFACFLGDKIPQVTDFDLTNAVDTTESLLEPIGIPRQVVIDHQVRALQVHAFTRGVGGNEHADVGIRTE